MYLSDLKLTLLLSTSKQIIKWGNFSQKTPYRFLAGTRLIVAHPLFSEFMGKTFQAAQLTHDIFLTIDNSCQTDLWGVVLYVTYSTTHQRSMEVQFGRYQKNILQEWSMVKNISCVSCAACYVFPINSLQSVGLQSVIRQNVLRLGLN